MLRGSATHWLAPLASWFGVLYCSGILKGLFGEVSMVPGQVGCHLACVHCLLLQGRSGQGGGGLATVCARVARKSAFRWS